MLTEDLPRCPFCLEEDKASGRRPYRKPNYSSGGGSFGGISQQSFSCEDCKATVAMIGTYDLTVLAYIPESMMSEPDEYGGRKYPTEWVEWADSVMLVSVRARRAEREAHAKLEWREWVDTRARTQWPEVEWGENHDPKKGNSYDEWPPRMRAEYDHLFGDFSPNLVGHVIPLPPEVARPLYPPQVPRSFPIFWRMKSGFKKVNPDYSTTLPVPEDPCLASNRRFFDDVFKAVFNPYSMSGLINDYLQLGRTVDREEIPNQYEGSKPLGTPGIQPWYSFEVRGTKFEIGRRKRVISIQATYPHLVDAKTLKVFADRDYVTYEAFGPQRIRTAEEFIAEIRSLEPGLEEETYKYQEEDHRKCYPEGELMRDGGLKSGRSEAEVVLIHAWDKESCIEYLTEMVNMALRPPPVSKGSGVSLNARTAG